MKNLSDDDLRNMVRDLSGSALVPMTTTALPLFHGRLHERTLAAVCSAITAR